MSEGRLLSRYCVVLTKCLENCNVNRGDEEYHDGLSLGRQRRYHTNPLQPSGHYMYHQFNIQQFYVLPTRCIYVFCVDLRTNSDYFPIHH